MECLNKENKNIGRRKSRTAKPSSLQSANMKKPVLAKGLSAPTPEIEMKKESSEKAAGKENKKED